VKISVGINPIIRGPANFSWSTTYTYTSVREQVASLAAAGVTTLLVSPLAASRAERVKDIAELKQVLIDASL